MDSDNLSREMLKDAADVIKRRKFRNSKSIIIREGDTLFIVDKHNNKRKLKDINAQKK